MSGKTIKIHHGLTKSQKLLLFTKLLNSHGSMSKEVILTSFGICNRTFRRWKADIKITGVLLYSWHCKMTNTRMIGTAQAYAKAMIKEMDAKIETDTNCP